MTAPIAPSCSCSTCEASRYWLAFFGNTLNYLQFAPETRYRVERVAALKSQIADLERDLRKHEKIPSTSPRAAFTLGE
jgi:hypothetical protein